MKNILILMMLLASTVAMGQKTIYDFKVESITGEEFNLADLKGKKVLIVNTASKCGLTPQYEGLEKLYKEYKNKDFIVIGFPANNFLKQEPGTNDEIKSFCQINYGVSFPMMAKISVKGDDIHPLYSWLTQEEKNGVKSSKVKWNFQKYLIDEQGVLVDIAYPKEEPYSDKILNWLNN